MLTLVSVSVPPPLPPTSGRRLERVERVVGVHVRLREAAQQRVHGARAQTWRTPVRRGGPGRGQLHGRPVHAEWVTVMEAVRLRTVSFHVYRRRSSAELNQDQRCNGAHYRRPHPSSSLLTSSVTRIRERPSIKKKKKKKLSRNKL